MRAKSLKKWWALTGSNRRPTRCKRDGYGRTLCKQRVSVQPHADSFDLITCVSVRLHSFHTRAAHSFLHLWITPSAPNREEG